MSNPRNRLRGFVLATLAIWIVALSPITHADVAYPPDESAISSLARQIQAVAAMRVTWAALLEALSKKDIALAVRFVLPEHRTQFIELAIGSTRFHQIDKISGDTNTLPCRLIDSTSGECKITFPTPAGGLENVHIPFSQRNGVWYVNL
jgi:hypothetical protein